MVAPADGFAAIVPVKSPSVGKSRLTGLSVDRRLLAAAFAADTVAACLATPGVLRVLAVTEDDDVARGLEALGAEVCPDGPVPGLNPALRHGASVARERWPSLTPVALLADLPALRPEDLGAALAAVADREAGGTSYVIDADGSGTTLYTAPYDDFAPRFGVDSAAAHAEAGAWPVPGELPSLRRDVDDADGLQAALTLGVGASTTAVLAEPTGR
ncbi:2-phospho-L-lactate guanylyltransferase [Nocardioides panacisoli]|uniref:2-phospho-L-lactate guanylyltransferase n=1 Tax=Nocardioides panacisoli TaxID=627624 RepID=A0ABP7I511_9ACTN